MCTIVALHGLRSDLPLVLAANRDEYYARTATGPQVLVPKPSVGGKVVGGRDERAGGTWLAVSERGLVVAITNQRTAVPPDADRRSRGALVIEAAAAGSVDAVIELLRARDAREYNPFNLLFGDGERLLVGYARDHQPAIALEELPPGLVVLANDRIGAPEYPKTTRAEALVRPHAEAPWPELRDALERALADHDRPPIDAIPAPPQGARFGRELLRELQALCIHTPAYGTRSSSIVAIAPGRVAHYLHAEGPPCQSRFEDVGSLLT